MLPVIALAVGYLDEAIERAPRARKPVEDIAEFID